MSADSADDGPEYICGADTEHTDSPCQFPVAGPDERCHNHPKDGSGPPEGQGSGSPDHQMGDGDGKIQKRLPDGAKPALDHGLHAVQDDPTGTLAWLEDNDPRGHDWVLDKWRSYLADAPFGPTTSKADDVLHACLMLYAVRMARDKQVRQGFIRREVMTDQDGTVVIDPETGDPVMVEREWAGNLPANRVAREARSILKSYGLLSDPESKKAEAMGWSAAAKEVALEVDSDVQDVDQGDTDD